MINNTDLYETRRVASEWNEDGDKVLTFKVRAKGFEGIKAYNAECHNYRGMGELIEWVGCGDGWLEATYYKAIDGVEIAIEARNDEWASRQQEIEDYCRGCWC